MSFPLIEIGGLELDNLSGAEALDLLEQGFHRRDCLQVCFVNAHCVNVAAHDDDYRRVVGDCWLRLPDGSGVRWGAWLLGQRVRENLNGTDLFPRLCARLDARGGSLALLGASPGRAEAVSRWVANHFPNVEVRYFNHGYLDPPEQQEAIHKIAHADCDVLLVALGVPTQEKWVASYAPALRVGVCLSVGGLFDFYSGSNPRAPRWIRTLGFEWAFRLWLEPRRLWRRYLLGNLAFLVRVARQRVHFSD